MKKLLLLAATVISMNTSAQLISSYKDVTPDEQSFKIMYGSVKEYNFEAGMKYKSTHKRLVMFIGAKYIWLDDLMHYCVENLKCSNKVNTLCFDVNDCRIPAGYELYPKITGGDDDTTALEMGYIPDDNFRMKEVKILGNYQMLVKLFIDYWYRDEVHFDINKIKKGCLLYENCGSDRITFNWKGKTPFIDIKKNPTFPKTLVPQN